MQHSTEEDSDSKGTAACAGCDYHEEPDSAHSPISDGTSLFGIASHKILAICVDRVSARIFAGAVVSTTDRTLGIPRE